MKGAYVLALNDKESIATSVGTYMNCKSSNAKTYL
jgi:hypothetical protein